MTRWFKEEADSAEDGRKSAIRALQAWQYLIGKAAARQIVQYDELRVLMEYPTSNPLGVILGCIMHYCQQNELPPLTLLVLITTQAKRNLRSRSGIGGVRSAT